MSAVRGQAGAHVSATVVPLRVSFAVVTGNFGLAQLYHGVNPDRPDPKLEVQAEALVKKNGFASLAEYDDVSTISPSSFP
ncbi:MAG: hypothetical protein WAN75_06870, partial [Xanthobacteraceae bacterium]